MHPDANKIRKEKTGRYICSKCGYDSYRIEFGFKKCNDCDSHMIFKEDEPKKRSE